jgi:peptidoglycan/LPS O-acetylase OafA/YrhL
VAHLMTTGSLHMDQGERFRLNGVDVLRGVSVLLVTLHHIHLGFWLNDYDVDSGTVNTPALRGVEVS